MKIFYDTEFLERGSQYPIDLISIGMINERGEELYLINKDAPLDDIMAHPWLFKNVVPYLPIFHVEHESGELGLYYWDGDMPDGHLLVSRTELRDYVYKYILDQKEEIELWAWYGAYDHVVLAQLWNTMAELPAEVPMWTNDIRQEMQYVPVELRQGSPKKENEHRAIDDARWNKKLYDYINQRQL